MGNGRKVRFWEDVWCGEAPLCSSFPYLYEVASSKGDMAAVLWEITGEGGGWNFRFKRHLNDWELEEAQRFIGIVSTKSLSPLTVDRMWWKGAKDGMFSVKSGYDVLDVGWQNLVPVKMIWNPIAPTKVGFFVWEAWWGKILMGWVCPYLVKELLMGWVWLPLKKKEAKVWRVAPLCLLWAIWIERNKVVFEDMQFSLDRLKTFL